MNRRNGTLSPDGPALIAFRKLKGWNHEELEWRTTITVEKYADAEVATGERNGQFTRYKRRRKRLGRTIGIGRGTIAAAEHGRDVFIMTLKIIALTLEVELWQVVRKPDAPRPWPVPAGSATDPVEELFACITSDASIDFARFLCRTVDEARRRGLDQLLRELVLDRPTAD